MGNGVLSLIATYLPLYGQHDMVITLGGTKFKSSVTADPINSRCVGQVIDYDITISDAYSKHINYFTKAFENSAIKDFGSVGVVDIDDELDVAIINKLEAGDYKGCQISVMMFPGYISGVINFVDQDSCLDIVEGKSEEANLTEALLEIEEQLIRELAA